MWSLLATLCGHVKPLFGLILIVLCRSTSDLSIGVLTGLIGCLEGNDLNEIVIG